MDIFGEAFRDFIAGDTHGVIMVGTSLTDPEPLPVLYFFREYEDMPPWEQLILNKSRGNILDVGAGSGSHALALQEMKKNVVAIDISPGAAEVMQARGVEQVRCADIWEFDHKGFDTILFLMNGIGIAGSLDRLPQLLRRAAGLLSPGGTIYAESTDLLYMFEEEDGSVLLPMGEQYYGEVSYQLSYKDQKGEPFPWLFVDLDNLAAIAQTCGLQTEVIYRGNDNHYVAALRRENEA